MAWVVAESNSSVLATVALTSVSAGDRIFVFISGDGAANSAISCSDGTSSLIGRTQVNHTNNDLTGRWFYLESSVATGAVTYTASFGTTPPFVEMFVFRCTNAGTFALDGEAGQENTGTAPTSGNHSPAGTDNIHFGACINYSGNTLSSPLINGTAADATVTNGFGSKAWYRITTAGFTGAATATWNVSSNDVCLVSSFKATAGGGGRTTKNTRAFPLGSDIGMAMQMC